VPKLSAAAAYGHRDQCGAAEQRAGAHQRTGRASAHRAPRGVDQVADDAVRLGRRRVELQIPRVNGAGRRGEQDRQVIHGRVRRKVGAARSLRFRGGGAEKMRYGQSG